MSTTRSQRRQLIQISGGMFFPGTMRMKVNKNLQTINGCQILEVCKECDEPRGLKFNFCVCDDVPDWNEASRLAMIQAQASICPRVVRRKIRSVTTASYCKICFGEWSEKYNFCKCPK
jgi:hypothetical protein